MFDDLWFSIVKVDINFDYVQLKWYYNKDWFVIVKIYTNNELYYYGKLEEKEFSGKEELYTSYKFAMHVNEFRAKNKNAKT